MAISAFLINSIPFFPFCGEMAIPILMDVMSWWFWMKKGRSNWRMMFFKSCSILCVLCSMWGKIIKNSSPPILAIKPLSGKHLVSLFAAAFNSRSPMLWPRASLIILNRFKSRKRTTVDVFVSSWADNTSFKWLIPWRRFGSSVNAS